MSPPSAVSLNVISHENNAFGLKISFIHFKAIQGRSSLSSVIRPDASPSKVVLPSLLYIKMLCPTTDTSQ
jgi:hypothetical protein